MGTLQIIKTRFSTVWKGIKGKCTSTKTPEFFAENKNITARKDLSTNLSHDLPPKNLPPKDLPLDEFVRTTPKPPRPITNSDKFNFRQYLLSKKVDLEVTPQEIKTLFNYEGEEFKLKSFEFLCKKMKVHEELKPQFIYGNEVQAAMYYDFALNQVVVNPNFAEQLADKSTFLTLLRHEMQHYSQNMQLFRHETKGKELIEVYAKITSKNVRINTDNYAKTLNEEQLKQIFDEEGMKEMLHLQKLLKENKMEEYEQYLDTLQEKLYQSYKPWYADFQKTVAEKMGNIGKNTSEGKRAERMFDDIVSESGYWNNDRTLNAAAYFSDMRENEAFVAQDMMTLRLNAITSGKEKHCYLKILRETQEKMQENIDKLNPQIQELMQKKTDEKTLAQVLAYLFD